MLRGKNAQIGETTTWLVATLIIIVILSLSIVFVQKSSFDKVRFKDSEFDFFIENSLYSYLLTDINGKKVYKIIDENGIEKSTGELALKVFREMYLRENGGDRYFVWFGNRSRGYSIFGENVFFGQDVSDLHSVGTVPYEIGSDLAVHKGVDIGDKYVEVHAK